jgi:hypothetical protein
MKISSTKLHEETLRIDFTFVILRVVLWMIVCSTSHLEPRIAMVPISSPTASEVMAMPDTRFNFNPPGPIRFLTSLLIFALASPPSGYAQQPQRPQTPQQRILVEGDPRTVTDKPAPSGPRAARPELVLQTGGARPAYNAVFSPDGRLLASMDRAAGSIKLWEIATGRDRRELVGESGANCPGLRRVQTEPRRRNQYGGMVRTAGDQESSEEISQTGPLCATLTEQLLL